MTRIEQPKPFSDFQEQSAVSTLMPPQARRADLPEHGTLAERRLTTSKAKPRRNRDSLAVYLGDISRIPLLTRSEERTLTERITKTREQLRKHLLSSEHVLNVTVQALSEVMGRRRRADQVLDVHTRGEGKGPRYTVLDTNHLMTLNGLLAENREDFRIVAARKPTASSRAAAARRMRQRQRNAARLLLELGVRWEFLEETMPSLLRIARMVPRIQQQAVEQRTRGNHERARRLRTTLGGLLCQAGESPARLHKRAGRLRHLQRQYERDIRLLTEHNLRLVVSTAKKFRGRGVSYLDLIQEGNMGLLRASDRFDFRRGCAFSTYAMWWIREAIQRSINNHSTEVRLPRSQRNVVRRLDEASQCLAHDSQRAPTLEELAAEISVTPQAASRLMRIARRMTPLDLPAGEHSNDLRECIIDENPHSVAMEKQWGDLRACLLGEMESLSERERTILQLRFGLNDGHHKTLEEVGRILSVSRETVRQVEKRAVRKLQQPGKKRRIQEFIDNEVEELSLQLDSA